MKRKIGMTVASLALGATAVIALPATAQAASWQPTGEAYTTSSRCWADASYYLEASNVYDYTCRKSGSLYYGYVYAD